MNFEIHRNSIKIYPAGQMDLAYIEDTLGLVNDGDFILLKQKNRIGTDKIDYLIAEKGVQL
jgi:hypothetical protein